VGPHAAEASMIPIDNSMADTGLDFLRYADDIFVLCETEAEAKRALHYTARIMDKQQRLMLQRHKTRIFNQTDLIEHCDTMLEDRAMNIKEKEVIAVINKYSSGDRTRKFRIVI
jgi:Reverse transcriptase (RNA-dependent DNA polymerase)